MLIMQDPTNPDSTYLLESLLDACTSATKLAGAFAYATASGVRLLTSSDVFKTLIDNHEVDLIVGVDGVTNNVALDCLSEAAAGHDNFRVRAFLNPRNDVIFHPKFCWTKNDDSGSVIVGSGNLTEAGLLGNWEAYSCEQVDLERLGEVESVWNEWAARHEYCLKPLDDDEVRSRATQNTVMARQGDLPTLSTAPADDLAEEVESSHPLDPSAVLIAELPKNRPGQADVGKPAYENFFGARVGEQRLVMFRHVEANGELSPYSHTRRGVEVSSHNYRFELAAASQLTYPKNGRPIVVFVRIATRTFLYHLLMPSNAEYANVLQILDDRDAESSVRRIYMNAAELRILWPTGPFWTPRES